ELVCCALSSNVHTYRLLIFKELYSVLLAEEALCSSAKRQDYELFRLSRQAFLFPASLSNMCCVLRGGEL
ncbi:hypothetical protein, partial [Duganella vulcania]|uniref:hypothetical protein n=1 Tax=Duganella vulcania TaxID=2692166 RepID=UPI001C2D5816